jgi:TonB-dependent starch-binding outer membrane protein SusC
LCNLATNKTIMRKKLSLLMVLCLGILASFAQTVTGKVTDVKNEPVPAATVQERGTQNITTTDAQGNFKLTLKKAGAIVITAVGYEAKTVTAAEAANVSLKTDVRTLTDVVVTGTGAATSKKKLAFAVESISADKLPNVSTADVGGALVGKIAGAQISSVNGTPGRPVNILLRGINSINAGTLPLILIDGVEVKATSLEQLDLAAYERIEVVQGAAAATIYGAQGANGVIQLFSKKGKAGKVSISISSSVASNTLLNIGGLAKARKHAFNVNGNNEVVTGGGAVLAIDPITGSYKDAPGTLSGFLINANGKYSNAYGTNLKYYDHYDEFFKTATTYNNSLQISGAKEKVDYSFILSDNRQNTVFANNGDFSRTNLTANIGIELAKGLRFRTTTQLVNTKSTLLDPTGRSMFFSINNAYPFANFSARDAVGRYPAYLGQTAGINHYNFYFVQDNAKHRDVTLDVIQSLNLNYKVNKFVELDAKYGLNQSRFGSRNTINDYSYSENTAFWPNRWLETYYPRTTYHTPANRNETGEINDRNYIETFHNFNANATIKVDFEKDLKLKVPITSTTLVGWDYRKRNITDYITYAGNAPSFTPFNTTNFAVFKTVRDYVEDFATYGILANQRFDYGTIGGLSFGLRSDYSSAFGQGSKPFTFPRGDAYLNLSSLGFYDKLGIANTITQIKLRAAYGEAGIQPGAYDRFPVLNTTNVSSTQVGFVYPIEDRSPLLGIQVTKETEIGTDINIKGGKGKWFNNFALAFTYWKRSSNDVITTVDVAPSQGVGRIFTNAMTLGSNGAQASLNAQIFTSKDFNWNMTTNFSKQNSFIETINGTNEIIRTTSAGSTSLVLKAGEQIGQLYGFLLLNAVDQKDPNGNFYIPQAQHGLYEVASNGWVVNTATKQPFATGSQVAMGDPNPKFNMSFINEFSYKDFLTFNFQIDWVHKSYLYNQTKQWMYRDGIHADYDKPITIGGQTEAWTAFYRGVYAVSRANGTKNYFLEDASFARLRNVSMAVDIAKIFKIKAVNKLQLVLSGRNLMTWTKYTGMDPEVSSGAANSAFDRGVDHNTIPNVKTYQVGLNVTF